MFPRTPVASFALVLLQVGALVCVAQKAYDMETFRGSSQEFEVTFNFAAGYGSASDASVLDKATGKRVLFRYDVNAPFGTMELLPEDAKEPGRLHIDVDPNSLTDHQSLKCTVHVGDKQQVITLKRIAP